MSQPSAAVYSGGDISRPNFQAYRQIVSSPEGEWVESVKSRLDHLMKLPRGWDGYGASSVRFENAYFAMQLLTTIWPEDMPAPQIVPGTDGDLQIEWHGRRTTIELHVKAPNDVSAFRETQSNPDGEDLHLTNNFIDISRWISELRRETGAAVTAAA